MAKTTLTPADLQKLNLLATHAGINAPHQARFHNFAADFEDLFPTPVGHAGQLDDYRSALGANAYLVDLVRLVVGHITPPQDDRLALPSRRPDIFDLELSEANANHLVPYLEIANRVMRTYLEQTAQIGPSALEVLAQSYFPFGMPFHQPLTEIRTYLRHFKLDLAEIYAAFRTLAHDPAWIAETLNLAPGELAYLATPTSPEDLNKAYGMAALGNTAPGQLGAVETFLSQTDLTPEQLGILVKISVPGADLSITTAEVADVAQAGTQQTITLAAATPAGDYTGLQIAITAGTGQGQTSRITDYNADTKVATVDAAWATAPDATSHYTIAWQAIEGLDGQNLDYLNRFIRLANRLGWPFDDLNWALTSIRPKPGSANVIDQNTLGNLAKIEHLRATYKLPIDVLCSFWFDLPATPPIDRPEGASLFDRIFNTSPFYVIGTAQAGTASTITLAGAAAHDAYRDMQIAITAGAGAGQVRTITAYDGATNVATLDVAWKTAPDSTSQYAITHAYTVGTARRGTKQSIRLAATASATNDAYRGMQITITAGTGQGQTRRVKTYKSSRIATVDAAWTTRLDTTSQYAIYAENNLPNIRAALFGALSVGDADGSAILVHLIALSGSLTLDLPTLTRFYRFGKLAQVLGMSVPAYLALLKLIARKPTASSDEYLATPEVASVDDLFAVAHWADWLAANRLNPFQLQFLTSRNHSDAEAHAVSQALTPSAATTAFGNYLHKLTEWAVKPTDFVQSGVDTRLAASIVEQLTAKGLLDSNGLVAQPATAITAAAIDGAIFDRLFDLQDGQAVFSDDQKKTWSPVKNLPGGSITQFVAGGQGLRSTLKQLLAQPQGGTTAHYDRYTQSIAQILRDALARQSEGSAAFWSEVFGAEAALTKGALANVVGGGDPSQQMPIAALLVRAFLVATGRAQAGDQKSIALAGATDGVSKGLWIAVVAGTGAGQARAVQQYDASKKIANVDPAWQTAPDSTSDYAVVALAVFDKIARLLAMARAFTLSAGVFQSILGHADTFGIAQPGAEGLFSLDSLRRIADFNQLTQAFARQGNAAETVAFLGATTDDPVANSAEGVLRYLRQAGGGQPPTLSMLSGWDVSQIVALADHIGAKPPYSLSQLATMQRCFDLAARLGVNIQLLIDLYVLHSTTNRPGSESWPAYQKTARAFLSVVRSKYSPEAWSKAFGPFRDHLNELERDALAAFLLRQLQSQFADIRTLQDLYEFLLVDVQMSGCAETTNMREALDCLQIYIQRCRMNLEAGVTLSQSIPNQMWDWMGHYRLWQANRELFFYPENYLDPTLRTNQATPEFKLLQNALLQGDISQDMVEQAYIDYFDRLDALANLQIVNGCYATIHNPNSGNPQDTLFLIGKTATEPPVYYQRQAMLETFAGAARGGGASTITMADTTRAAKNAFAGWLIAITGGKGAGQTRIIVAYDDTTQIATIDGAWQTPPDGTSQYTISSRAIIGWSPWQKIGVNIPADQALPLYAADRLYIFWVEQKTINDRDKDNNRTSSIQATIKFSYQQVSGRWMQPQVLKKDVDIATLPQSYRFAPDGQASQGTHLLLLHHGDAGSSTPQAVLSLVTPDLASILQLLVSSLFAAPARVVGGIAISANNAATWSPVGSVTGSVNQIVAIGNQIFVATSSGLFTLTDTDNGTTGSPVGGVSGSVTQIVLIGSTIYVGTNNPPPSFNLFTLTETNQEWTASQAGNVILGVTQIVVIGNWIYLGTPIGLYASADGGGTWGPALGTANTFWHIISTGSMTYISNLNSGGLFVASPGGATWSPVGGVTGSVTQMFVIGNHVFIGTTTGLFKIVDNGATGSQVGGVSGSVNQVVAIGTTIFIGSSDGLFTSADNGATGGRVGGVTGSVNQIVAIGDQIFVGTSSNPHSLFASADSGATWRPIDGMTESVNQIVAIGNQIFVGTDTGLYKEEIPTIPLIAPAIPLIAAGGDTWLALPTPQQSGPPTYAIDRITTSCVDQLRQILVQGGLDALLTLSSQQLSERSFTDLKATNQVAQPYPPDALSFELSSAYGLYFREIFFHIPYLVGTALQARQQFEAARRWYEYIFNPLAPVDASAKHPADRFWGYLPFRDQTLDDLVASIDQQQYQAYEDDPFDPFAIAELRPYAYQKALAMQYIDNLIAWGDSLYALDGWENLNAATTLYVLAAELLGPRPQRSRLAGQGATVRARDAGDDTHQPHPGLADLVKLLEAGGNTPTNPFFDVPAFFVVPENDEFADYWKTVEQRLYQIRNCMNLQGVVRQLPVFDPAIDPRQLLRALAAGRSISSVANRPAVVVPHYRFAYLLERARQVVSELKQLGSALLNALEKQDAEQLARLRNTYEAAILALTTQTKQKQQEENQHSLDGLQQSLAAAQARYSRYQGWASEYLSPGEIIGLSITQASSPLKEAASSVKILSSVGYAIPNIYGLADGGMNFGAIIAAAADALAFDASILEVAGQLALTKAQYDRRRAEWQLQADMAAYEVRQISAQIDALTAHQAIVDQELAIHQQSITQNQGIDQYYRQKFNNQELYQWMVSQLGILYSQTYQLALDLARMTERAFQYERDTDVSYVDVNGWDSLKQGLLAGEGLALNLNQLEKAYIEQNARQLEIEKTISLGQLDPLALLDLKRSGRCTFRLREAHFDLDFPGHYLRKIKTISLSIPAVVGPYQNVHATLIQQSSQVVLKPDLETVKLLLDEASSPQPDSSTLRSNWQVNQQVAISRGVNDAGLFELNFNDERYLPFEGTGAVSSWELRMPRASNRFSFDSISDVIITLHYTARYGGDAFRQQLLDTNTGPKSLQTLSGYRVFTVRQLNSAGWQAVKAGKQAILDLSIDQAFFPLNLGSTPAETTESIAVYPWPAQKVGPAPFSLVLPSDTSPGLEGNNASDSTGWEFTTASPETLIGTWTLQLSPDAKTALQAIDDLLIIVPFQGALNWGS